MMNLTLKSKKQKYDRSELIERLLSYELKYPYLIFDDKSDTEVLYSENTFEVTSCDVTDENNMKLSSLWKLISNGVSYCTTAFTGRNSGKIR